MKRKNVFLKPRGVPYYVKATDPDSGLSHVAYFPHKKEAVAFFLYCVTMNRNPAMGWSIMAISNKSNGNWDRTGTRVAGVYINTYTVLGLVTDSRVKYGGAVQHTVKLDTPMEVFGHVADVVLLNEEELFV